MSHHKLSDDFLDTNIKKRTESFRSILSDPKRKEGKPKIYINIVRRIASQKLDNYRF